MGEEKPGSNSKGEDRGSLPEAHDSVPPESKEPARTGEESAETGRPRRRSRTWLLAVVIAILALFLIHHYSSRRGPSGVAGAQGTGAKGRGQSGPAAITVGQSKAGDIDVYVNALGTVTPIYTVTIYSQITGRVMAVHYREGQMVHKGDPLIDIDPRPYQAMLTQAEGTLERDQGLLAEARIDLERYRAASARNAIAKQQLDDQEQTVIQYQGTVKADQGAVAYDRVQLAYCHISAPITGRVGLRLVDPGNTIFSGSNSTLVVITQLQPITVVFNVSEDNLPQVQEQLSSKHRLQVDAFDRASDKQLESGKLTSLDNQVDTTTGTVKFRAEFPNRKLSLFPNQFVNARLLVNTLRNVTLVPSAAVQHNGTAAFVYIVNSNNTVTVQPITTLTGNDLEAAVKGLNPGITLATSGFDRLENGAQVAVHAPVGNPPPGGASGSMSPSRPFILRPVATALLMLAVFLAGVVAYLQLPVSALPEVDYPTIQVLTFYPGASPDVVASAVTAPLERQFGEVAGLSQMTSTSAGGVSVIVMQFQLSLNIDVAEQEVQAAINAAQSYLPANLPTPPVYSKSNPADAPVLTLALTSSEMALSRVEDLADTRLAPKISQISGVGLVSISGGEKPAVRIQANPTALASYGINLEDLRTALTGNSLNSAKGNFDGPSKDFTINANDQLLTSTAYKSVVVAYRNGAPVMLSDVAHVIDGVENAKLAAWMNFTPAVILNIQRQPGANTIQVVDSIQKVLPQLVTTLPRAVHVETVTDRTTSIRASVKDVEFELLLVIVLVVMVIFLFLRSLSATVIPSIAVPISLVGTFAVMYLAGYSLNNLTMMALTISTGFVVDDAIVMIENISRYIEEGEKPLEAALKGAEQIGFTILSLTVSLIAVLIPLLFMGDVAGRLFRQFAVTLAVTIVLSAFVSLTLTPMMSARLLRYTPPEKQGRFYRASQKVFDDVIAFYGRTLRFVLGYQTITLLVAVATLVLTVILYITIPKGFFPTQDTGIIQGISQAAADTSFPSMTQKQQGLAKVLLDDPAVESISSFIGADGTNTTLNSGRIQINLKPLDQRGITATEVIRRLGPKLAKVEGIKLYMQPVQDLTVDDRVSRTQYQYTLEDPNPDVLNTVVHDLVSRLQQLPQLADVATDQQLGGVAESLIIDRATASRFGITPQTIDNTLYDAFGQRQINTLYTQLNQYHVILETDPKFQRDPRKLHDIYIQSSLNSSSSSPSTSNTAGSSSGAGANTSSASVSTLLTPTATGALSPVYSTSALSSANRSTVSAASSVNSTSALSPPSTATSSTTVLSNTSTGGSISSSANTSSSGTSRPVSSSSGGGSGGGANSGVVVSNPVPLSAFSQFHTQSEALSVNHQGQFPAVTISFNLGPGYSLGEALEAINKVIAESNIPSSVVADYQGTAAAFQGSLSNEGLLILAALVTVYIVLGVLYESFVHPITILSTLPSAGVGALLALELFHLDLDIVAIIGIILLIGIVKKNGIMMVDFALEAERKEGKSATEAIYQASLLRFRPIMMTTMAALLSGLPLAFGSGIGSELRKPLGVAMVGGLIFSQVLTLYTTPVIYIFFDNLGARLAHRRRQPEAEHP